MTVLPYSLALALKEAGWPQYPKPEGKVIWPHDFLKGEPVETIEYAESAYSPSLSELIGSCPAGGQITLTRPKYPFKGGPWEAVFNPVDPGEEYSEKDIMRAYGLTPEEAIANLWLLVQQQYANAIFSAPMTLPSGSEMGSEVIDAIKGHLPEGDGK